MRDCDGWTAPHQPCWGERCPWAHDLELCQGHASEREGHGYQPRPIRVQLPDGVVLVLAPGPEPTRSDLSDLLARAIHGLPTP